MSQRTRDHTTGAAARPTNRTEPTVGQANEATRSAQQAPAAEAPRRGKRTAPAEEQGAGLPLSPDALARALRAVATELERDPALAQRVAQAIGETTAAPAPSEHTRQPARRAKAQREPVAEPAPPTIGRSFHPTIVTGIDEALGPGVPDPFALRQRLGEAGLREALASLRLGSLRAIIRQHQLDSTGSLSKLNDAEKLRAHILAATLAAGE